jgi:predicted CXXCH cytochrome family protein
VGSETCATCHEDVGKNFAHAYHAQQGVTCEQCHGNGSRHVDGGGDVTKIISLKKRSAAEANSVCLSCHSGGARERHWMSGVHAANGVRCIDCHQVHSGAVQDARVGRAVFDTRAAGTGDVNLVSPETNNVVQSRAASNDACLRCHQTQNAQLSMPYHHPVREGKMSCADCHDPHGGTAGHNLRTANVNELCLGCHAQYRGPFAYQHPPVAENCLNCHAVHGSPNSNLLTVSMPALCLQCHTGHHNGAGLPLADRCTNCHGSIHGTDVATPSGGSRFVDKGQWGVPSEPVQAVAAELRASAGLETRTTAGRETGGTMTGAALSNRAAGGLVDGGAAMLAARLRTAPMMAAAMADESKPVDKSGASSWTPVTYRFLDVSGFAGRVGEYDSLEQSVGSSVSSAYVDTARKLTLVSRGTVISGEDYSLRSQLTVSRWLKAGLDLRSLVQQQDHYPNYIATLSSDFAGNVTDTIPQNSVFGVTRRLGSGNARVKLPHIPVHVFVSGNWQARAGKTQLAYLDENSTAAVYVDGANTTCGQQCHSTSQYQPVNLTTRNVSGGVDAELARMLRLSYQHTYSHFNNRLVFPTASYTGPFTPEDEGFSTINPPPSGPAPKDVPAGNYYIDIPSPNEFSADTVTANFVPAEAFAVNAHATYTRLRNTFMGNPQKWFDTDETVNWAARERLRVTADYHQQNMINGFTPYYTLYGNESYHRHWEGVRAEIELPWGFALEPEYKRTGITRSNAALWPQVYSFDNTDLQTVIPSSTSNTAGLALLYRAGGLWNARAGYEWTGTDHPGFLIVPHSNNRVFANVWVTPGPWLTLASDTTIVAQNAFAAIALPNTPGDFTRRNRFYMEALSATLQPVPIWNFEAGYSYQQNNLKTYMAFQNDNSVGYVVDDPAVLYKQLSQVVWGESTYRVKQHGGLDLRLTHDLSTSGYRADLNPNDAAGLGNASLIQQGTFDAGMFGAALGNVAFGATQISAVRVPQWIGNGKAYYVFPHRVEGGTVFYYGSYADRWNSNLNGVLRTFDVYVAKTW